MTLERDYQRFVELMERAGELTVMPNGKDLGRAILALFGELKMYPFEAVKAAVDAHCRSERFFPMLADIVTRIEGRAEDRAAAAWALVLKAVARHGRSDSVRFPSPAIHYAISQMGGWRALCQSLTTESIPFRARDFAGYFAVGERVASWRDEPGAGKVRVPAYLAGEYEMNNRARGFEFSRVWDAETGQLMSEEQPPALSGSPEPVGPIIQLMARSMDAREAAR